LLAGSASAVAVARTTLGGPPIPLPPPPAHITLPGTTTISEPATPTAAPGHIALPAGITTNAPCYRESASVKLRGRGFTPGSSYSVSVDGFAQGGGAVTPQGTLTGSLSSGTVLPATAQEVPHTVTVTDGSTTAATHFLTTQFSATFAPTAGNPATLEVRYTILGFGLGNGTPGNRPPFHVYLHYVLPNGKLGPTVELGPTHGSCGDLPLTRLHHLFPFHTSSRGTWHLQFDLSKHYSPASTPRVVRSVYAA
jgi:hypothetical protein